MDTKKRATGVCQTACRFAYGRVMTLVSCDDDLDWEFALIRTMGIRPVLEEPMAKRSKKGCEELPILHPDAAGIDVGVSELFVAVSADLDPQGAVGRYRPIR